MATRCVDISENKKLAQESPVAMVITVVCFIIETALMKPGIVYLICILLTYAICHILFFYSPRFVFLTFKFLFSNSYLTPTFEDYDYLPNEYDVPELAKLLKGSENADGIEPTTGH